MKLKLWFTIPLFLITIFGLQAQAPVRIILDTDIDSDVDDVGALAMLHTLADHEVVDLLGVVVTSDDRYAPLCVDAINHYFGWPELPVGVEKGIELRHHSRYTQEISEEYKKTLLTYEEAEDATDLYRRLLADHPDTSVVILSIGHLTNLQHLLESGPDQHSPLTGMELIKKKVRFWSCMGGQFPEGKEANFYRPDPKSTQTCVDNWPTKVVFSGWEVGTPVITGGEKFKERLSSSSPVWRAYQLFNNFKGRQSWDQIAVLVAIPDYDDYWNLENEGYCKVFPDGSNKWIPGDPANQSYVIPRISDDKLAMLIENLMAGEYSGKN